MLRSHGKEFYTYRYITSNILLNKQRYKKNAESGTLCVYTKHRLSKEQRTKKLKRMITSERIG